MNKNEITLYDFQQKCVDKMKTYEGDAALIVMATGLGKTATFCEFVRYGVQQNGQTFLLLAHREELVTAPIAYLPPSVHCGVEQASQHARGQPVICASVQTLVNRLKKYNPREFDYIIVDEAHHAAATTYRTIIDYFVSAKILGFTATARRGDGIGLDCVFDDILFDRNLLWAIENKYLVPIDCVQAFLKYRLESVKIMPETGDFSEADIANAMSGTALGVAEIYQKHARGQTIIFASSIGEAKAIKDEINKQAGHNIAAYIDANTQNRARIFSAFEAGIINVIVNFNILTEGIDLPCTETVLIARPIAHTNIALYAQMVGRGLRLYKGKDSCRVIDCVGISTNPICTAATLIGKEEETKKEKDPDAPSYPVPEKEIAVLSADEAPDSWVNGQKHIDVVAKGEDVDTHDLAIICASDGSWMLQLPTTYYYIFPPDENGLYLLRRGKKIAKAPQKLQFLMDYIYTDCTQNRPAEASLWKKSRHDRWADNPITDKQYKLLQELSPDEKINTKTMTRGDASALIQLLSIKKRSDENATAC